MAFSLSGFLSALSVVPRGIRSFISTVGAGARALASGTIRVSPLQIFQAPITGVVSGQIRTPSGFESRSVKLTPSQRIVSGVLAGATVASAIATGVGAATLAAPAIGRLFPSEGSPVSNVGDVITRDIGTQKVREAAQEVVTQRPSILESFTTAIPEAVELGDEDVPDFEDLEEED